MDPPGDLPSQISPRTALIASFALCGFANIGSVAIQVGGLGAMAPSRRADLAKLGLRAMFAGALATCMTACVAGVLSA
jgi:CNT family concentrative nucleoside transporter